VRRSAGLRHQAATRARKRTRVEAGAVVCAFIRGKERSTFGRKRARQRQRVGRKRGRAPLLQPAEHAAEHLLHVRLRGRSGREARTKHKARARNISTDEKACGSWAFESAVL
jgi:hypothetical protein